MCVRRKREREKKQRRPWKKRNVKVSKEKKSGTIESNQRHAVWYPRESSTK